MSLTETNKVFCSQKGYEKTECTFDNCPVYWYLDCYESAKEDCQANKPLKLEWSDI